MKLPNLTISPEFKAQGNGVATGILVGWAVCALTGIPSFSFFIFSIISMSLLGLVFVAYDAARANAGKPLVSLRTFFWRGVGEALLGFVLNLCVVTLRSPA